MRSGIGTIKRTYMWVLHEVRYAYYINFWEHRRTALIASCWRTRWGTLSVPGWRTCRWAFISPCWGSGLGERTHLFLLGSRVGSTNSSLPVGEPGWEHELISPCWGAGLGALYDAIYRVILGIVHLMLSPSPGVWPDRGYRVNTAYGWVCLLYLCWSIQLINN